MYFKSIELENFRNYEKLRLDFHRNLNLFLGNNAQGKTNLIESLFIMGLGKSFRTNRDPEMISFGKDFARASCLIEGKNGESRIEIIYQREGKILKLDGIKLDRTADLLENVYIVVFSPEDLRIVKEGPEQRRRFLDRELCQIKPLYYSDLGNYKRILRQRNSMLKCASRDMDLYDIFDASLSEYGARIVKERRVFAERLQDISSRIHGDISQGKEALRIDYESDTEDPCELREKLKKDFEKDMQRGFTGSGPHKDDLRIEIDGVDIRNYGSQGQKRTAALSMKLAEIGLIKQETGCEAVLLLDDVLSELDLGRQRYLIESVRDVQVFIAGTDIDPELKKLLPEGFEFCVDSGKVKLLT